MCFDLHYCGTDCVPEIDIIVNSCITESVVRVGDDTQEWDKGHFIKAPEPPCLSVCRPSDVRT